MEGCLVPDDSLTQTLGFCCPAGTGGFLVFVFSVICQAVSRRKLASPTDATVKTPSQLPHLRARLCCCWRLLASGTCLLNLQSLLLAALQGWGRLRLDCHCRHPLPELSILKNTRFWQRLIRSLESTCGRAGLCRWQRCAIVCLHLAVTIFLLTRGLRCRHSAKSLNAHLLLFLSTHFGILLLQSKLCRSWHSSMKD